MIRTDKYITLEPLFLGLKLVLDFLMEEREREGKDKADTLTYIDTFLYT